ncbi:hypothetical protein [Saccharomonospora xinjiangensis]|uniref:hypothetical protein n=1 Tax=Saccharomonospora xinjiangensis TaxID=75294 RepID=UPI0010700DA8|nr:hypothetical protein [Saccharomonospora xinjiangensis]
MRIRWCVPETLINAGGDNLLWVSTGSHTDFGPAARRHYSDALHLRDGDRLPNADHLAGVAAECALKAILLNFLGGFLNRKGRPAHVGAPSKNSYCHLPGLWDDIGATVHGRRATTFVGLLAQQNPFLDWDVAERYSAGTHITGERVDSHLRHAHAILEMYEHATITGALP